MMLTDLVTACRRSGLIVVEQTGWAKRGHGEMSGVRTIMCHHTAGAPSGESPSLRRVMEGGPDLAGPLSQLFLTRSGIVHVIAAGLCYHAGHVMSPSTQGNAWSIGIEAEATGTAAWPEDQYRAYTWLVRGLIDHYGLPPSAVIGHKEAAVFPPGHPKAGKLGRKIDPNFNMAQFRADVAGVVRIGEDPFMALTAKEQREILEGVRRMKPGVPLPARSDNCRVRRDDHYGHAMNGEAEAADARVAAETTLAEMRGLRGDVMAAVASLAARPLNPRDLPDDALRSLAEAVNAEIARRQSQ